MIASLFRTAFAQPGPESASDVWDQVHDRLAATFPKIGPLMDAAKAEVLAFTAFPRSHWAKIWSTNPLESRRPTERRTHNGRTGPCRTSTDGRLSHFTRRTTPD